jgi:hypothetical protein
MTRLKHTARGFRRYMQISNSRLFAFVEGKDIDPFFYGRLCESVCVPLKVSYEVVLARQLPEAGGGGKEVLSNYFRYLRRVKSLTDDFKEKITTAIFFADKDVDDIQRNLLRSAHMIYTEFYQVENYLFLYGNLVDSAACSAGLDRLMVFNALGAIQNWPSVRAQVWREWVKVCLFVKTRRICGQANYGVVSPLNDPALNVTDQAMFQQILNQLQRASGLTNRQFARAFRRTSARVDRLYAEEKQDQVFKGKWYAHLMSADIEHLVAGMPYDGQHFPHRLLTTLSASLNYEAPWSDYFKLRIRQLLG